MKNFWISVALRALGYITSAGFIESVKVIVKSYINKDIEGKLKRERAFDDIKAIGYEASSWMINASIEVTLGYFKIRYPDLFVKKS